MTTSAGIHHHGLGTASILDGGAFAIAAVGLLLSTSLLVGGPSPIPVTGSASPATVRTIAKVTRPIGSTTTTAKPAIAVPTVAPAPPAVAPDATPAAAASTTPATAPPAAAPAFTTECGDALAFLASHQAPGFVDTCAPGSALGHYGYTCATVPGRCDGVRIIHIACPAPFVFMNEAHNSWTVIGQGAGIDPYGQGNAAEQAACNRYR